MLIEAYSKSIRSLILDDNISFRIPIYQRSYSWQAGDQVRKLFDDIIEFAEETGEGSRVDYYIGNIILKKMATGGFSTTLTVIDGQQRITSIILMLCAVRDLYLEGETNDQERRSARAITHALYRHDGDEIRIKLNNMEHQKTLNLLLSGNLDAVDQQDRTTTYWKNYHFIRTELSKLRKFEDWRIRSFAGILDRVKAVAIFLDQDQDENSVFESINSAGMPLAGPDLIKNFVFTFKFPATQQALRELEELYTEKFESQFAAYGKPLDEIEDFFREYIAVKTGQLVKQDPKTIYYAFKKWVEGIDTAERCREVILDLIKWAVIYNILRLHGHQDLDPNNLGYLRGSFGTYATLLMDMVDRLAEVKQGIVNVYDRQQLNRAIARVVAYDVSRFLAGNAQKTLARFIPTIPKRLEDIDPNFFHDYASAFTNLVMGAQPGQRQPGVSEIRSKLEVQNLYSNPKQLTRFLVLLDNFDQNEQISFEQGLRGCQIEHIMPQQLGAAWQHISPQDHERYIHNLGNLSITFDNSTLSNVGFLDKRRFLAELSRVRLNQMLLDYETFGPVEIQDRAQRLLDRFIQAYDLPDAPWAKEQVVQPAEYSTAQQWLDEVRASFNPPELAGFPIVSFWSEVCEQLGIPVGGNSARRALDAWRRKHRPHWPSSL